MASKPAVLASLLCRQSLARSLTVSSFQRLTVPMVQKSRLLPVAHQNRHFTISTGPKTPPPPPPPPKNDDADAGSAATWTTTFVGIVIMFTNYYLHMDLEENLSEQTRNLQAALREQTNSIEKDTDSIKEATKKIEMDLYVFVQGLAEYVAEHNRRENAHEEFVKRLLDNSA